MKNKKLVISLLVLLSLVVTGFTFAYWASGVNVTQAPNATGDIEVGVGQDAETTVTITPTLDDGVLVPAGRATGSQVEELTFTFEVTWEAVDDTAIGTNGTLLVTASANHTLFVVTPTYNTTIVADGASVLVTVVVTLNEPANQTEYAEVAGNNFTLTVTFNVSPN